VWHELCDWYVELIKPALSGDDEDRRLIALSVLVHVFEASLAMLHPFMPFITEEIWQQIPAYKDVRSVCIRRFPTRQEGLVDNEAESRMSIVMDAITGVRSIRGELNISPSKPLDLIIIAGKDVVDILVSNIEYVERLARASSIKTGSDLTVPRDAASSIKPDLQVYIPLKGLIDVEAETSRLRKELAKTEKELNFVKKKLANENFLSNAPEEVVEENRSKYNELIDKVKSINSNIEKLGLMGKD
jgi:valyl-tRNA synthetase